MYEEIAEKLKNGRKVIMVHGNADMDAVSSAYAISRCFPDCDIYAPNSIDRVSRFVQTKMNIPILEECDINSYDLVVVVDTSSPEQFGLEDFKIPENCIVIDHHQPTGRWTCDLYCEPDKCACAQIVLEIIRDNCPELPRDVGLMLLGGMLTDSGHFQYGDYELLKDFAYILETTGIEMDEALALTRTEASMSERVATMKYIGRSKFDRVGDMIVAVSFGGSFEASGCRALLQSGADVAFVASQRDDNFRLSARATQEMVRRGINLGCIVKDIGYETVTDGGGHDGAAGLSGIGDAEAILHICMMRTMDEFRKIKKNRESAGIKADE